MIFMSSSFLTITKVSRTLQVVLYLDSKVLLVYRLFVVFSGICPYTLRTGYRFEPISFLHSSRTTTIDTLSLKSPLSHS